MVKLLIRGIAFASLGIAASASSSLAQNAPRAAPAPPGTAGADVHAAGDIPGPIDNLQDLQDTGKMLFKLADMNNNGLISKKEAIDAANLLVGGFFFRADANGDGTVSQEEARQARDSFLKQKPVLKAVLERLKNAQDGHADKPNPIKELAKLLDSNNDKQLQASEVRKAVETAVQSLYDAADTNRDGQLSPAEVNAAIIGMTQSMAKSAFQAADTDHNGSLSWEEFDKMLEQPARIVFQAIDANNDGQISPQEAQEARRVVITQIRMLRVPEPANSLGNLIRSGVQPEQVTPVPDFGTPSKPRSTTGTSSAEPRSK